jgi:CheY-like chemotaxis protein
MTALAIHKTYIVDDDPIFVFVLKKLLQKHTEFGIVQDYKDGYKALETILESDFIEPTILLLDINMPLLDGWQFLEKLQEANFNNNLSVFVMSSSIDINDIDKAKEFSVVKDFISKPITHDKLDKIIQLLS